MFFIFLYKVFTFSIAQKIQIVKRFFWKKFKFFDWQFEKNMVQYQKQFFLFWINFVFFYSIPEKIQIVKHYLKNIFEKNSNKFVDMVLNSVILLVWGTV